jgi:hypothetical protein
VLFSPALPWFIFILLTLLLLWLIVNLIRRSIRDGRERDAHRRHGGHAPRK